MKGDPELADLTKSLIAALVERASDNVPAAVDTLKRLISRTSQPVPQRIDPTKSAAWHLALNLGGARQLLGVRGRVTPDWLEGMLPALVQLGICSKDDWPKDANTSTWKAFLEQTIVQASLPIDETGGAFPKSEALLSDPEWRIVRRDSEVDEVIARLNQVSAVSICGMSGSGKSLLLRQVLAQLRDSERRVLEIDARPFLEAAVSRNRSLQTSDYVGLCSTLIFTLASLAIGNGLGDSKKQAASDLIKAHFGRRKSEYADGVDRNRESFLNNFAEDVSWDYFLSVVQNCGHSIPDMPTLSRVASILRFGLSNIVIAIDDVLDFHLAFAVIEPLFKLLPNEIPAARSKFIITSSQTNSLSFLGKELDYELGGNDRPYSPSLCLDIVAAWSVDAYDELTSSAAVEAIQKFREDEIEKDAKVKCAIEKAISFLQGHPLALAAVASASRQDIRNLTRFWDRATDTIASRPTDILSFDPQADLTTVVPHRQRDVLNALAFAWSTLTSELQERYLDLAIAHPGDSLDEQVFDVFWQYGERPNCPPLPAAMAAHKRPFHIFARNSLLRPTNEPGRYTLHDLYRILIRELLGKKLGGETLGDRHREFLRAMGLLTGSIDGDLDGKIEFVEEDARLRLIPKLEWYDKDPDELGHLGDYLIRRATFHFVRISDQELGTRLLSQWLSDFRVLRAALDVPDKLERPEQGNVTLFWSQLVEADGLVSEPYLGHLRKTVGILSVDRSQLGFQITARAPPDNDAMWDQLVSSTIRRQDHGYFFAQFPFLLEKFSSLRITSFHRASVSDATLIACENATPTILSWAEDGSVQLWDASSGLPLIEAITHRGYVGGAEWIERAPQGSSILSWSLDGTVMFSSAQTGHLRFEALKHAGSLRGATFIHSQTSGPVIVSWSADWTVRVWSAIDGKPLVEPLIHDGPVQHAEWIEGDTAEPLILSWSESQPEWRRRRSRSISQAHGLFVDEEWAEPPTPHQPDDARSSLFLWHVKAGVTAFDPVHYECDVSFAKWVNDPKAGPSIFAQFGDCVTGIWHRDTGKSLRIFCVPGGITHAEWVHDYCDRAVILATASAGERITILDAETGKSVKAWQRCQPPVSYALWIRDTHGEPRLLVWYLDGTITLITVNTGEELTIHDEGGVISITPIESAGHCSSFILFNVDDEVSLHDAKDGKMQWHLAPQHHHIRRARWAPFERGTPAIITSSSDGGVRVFDVKAKGIQAVPRHTKRIIKVDWVIGRDHSEPSILILSRDSTMRLMNASTGDLRFSPIEHSEGLVDAIPTTHGILSWTHGGSWSIWDVGTGREVIRQNAHEGEIWFALPVELIDGSSGVLTGGSDGLIKGWTLSGQQFSQSLEFDSWICYEGRIHDSGRGSGLIVRSDRSVTCCGVEDCRYWFEPIQHDDDIRAVKLLDSPAGSTLVTFSRDGVIKFSDARTGILKASLFETYDRSVLGVLCNERGTANLMACGNGLIRVFDSQAKEYYRASSTLFDGKDLSGVKWLSQTSRVFGWRHDGTIFVWDLSVNQPAFDPIDHGAWLIGAIWIEISGRAPAILSYGANGTMKLWSGVTGRLIRSVTIEDTPRSISLCPQTSGAEMLFAVGGELGSVGVVGFRW
ncbi:WD40 repeat protein [Rhodopseudomonas rhenobacensis]|uniref:WD40 repeat protein n=1 Tax=Rhodopseudomonas rhenobacensis TaxID=87461 RepID=A0A7W8E143_9BRAD|nr:hypothetical protein [Rhodopseudomonas rhenobacensis]MBB5048531.1 WD40 repeat protein [Rhodopseudomonas rhenobacensis]